ncbi:MAG: RNA polymerase Rpb6 [Crocinitomicaceae bacterium]|nr:RNA polymerase Rpb6 [Crocinitomicaceae bacterium]
MSNYKNSNAAKTTITRNTNELYDKVDSNLFEAVVLLSKRSNQVSREMKEELEQKIKEFSTHQDNLEEVFENREQIEISRHYERMPKAHSVAVQELLDDALYFRYPEEETN